MIFTFGNFIVDVDVKKTQEIYKKLRPVSNGCDCDGCQNYEKAIDVLPEDVRRFFDLLGIDMKKITECMTYCKTNDGKAVICGGFYHLCGTMISDGDAWVENGENMYHLDQDMIYKVGEDFGVAFSKGVLMLEDEFDAPVLQLEIEATIPWVLNKENTY